MASILRITDYNWFKFHKSILNDEVIFWTPGTRMSGPIKHGEYLFFYVKSKPRMIGGYGILKEKNTSDLSKLWDKYKYKLGHNSLNELITTMNKKTGSHGEISKESIVGYYHLVNVFYFDDPIKPDRTYKIKKEKKYTWINDFGIFECDYDSVWGKSLTINEMDRLLKVTEEKEKQGITEKIGWKNTINKAKVEEIAIDLTTKKLVLNGWEVTSVEKDNVGYDLFARTEKFELFVEVKGLSGDMLAVELTSNEYNKLKKYKEKYIISIVSNCLSENPKLKFFSYNSNMDRWSNKSGKYLEVYERTSATFKVV